MTSTTTHRTLRMSYVVASIAGIAFFVLSVVLLGLWPARVLGEETRLMSPEHPLDLTASELRGRVVYSREGCAYCHTQQVRYLHSDMTRFGRPTLAWETRFDYPQLWGTRRIGPDLAREASARSDDWQYAHLFAPRTIVPDSVMPAYVALFDGAADRPRQEARDLVAYLNTLGRARELAGPEGEAHARDACQCPDDEMRAMAFQGPLNAHSARASRTHTAPPLPEAQETRRGDELYARVCAGCHGTGGDGRGPAADALLPRPTNLVEHEYTVERLADVMWNGYAGTSMPAWRDHSLDDLSAIAQTVRRFSTSREDVPLPANLAELGARVYAANCVQCHGERGAGDGAAAAKLPIAPTNFRLQRPTLAESVRVIREGIDGTPMAPWTSRLDNADVIAVAHYVRGFYQMPLAANRLTRR